MPDLAIIVLLGLSAYRAARLIATDSITDQARAAIYRWAWEDMLETRERTGTGPADPWPCSWDATGEPTPCPRGRWRPYLYELVSCPFCVGVWMSGAAFAVWAIWLGRWPNLAVSLLVVLAIAGVQSLAQCVDAALVSVSERGE